MTTNRGKRPTKDRPGGSHPESGQPGGGKGRKDVVGHSGVYPGSGPYPSGDAPVRTPADFVHGQTDAEGRPVEGGSELTYLGGNTLLGGATPPSSGPAAAKPKARKPTLGKPRTVRPKSGQPKKSSRGRAGEGK